MRLTKISNGNRSKGNRSKNLSNLIYIASIMLLFISIVANIVISRLSEDIDYKLNDVYYKQRKVFEIKKVVQEEDLQEPVTLPDNETKFAMLKFIDQISKSFSPNSNIEVKVDGSFYDYEPRVKSINLRLNAKNISGNEIKDILNLVSSTDSYFFIRNLSVKKHQEAGADIDAEIEYRKIYK